MNYAIKTPNHQKQPNKLPFCGYNPKTKEQLGVTDQYFTKNEKPWLPVMGEFHFSRYDCNLWEEEILKIKAGGINIIGTYVFWVHHEEIEGEFDWSGNRELSRFLSLCTKNDMKLILRIGPWSHGECRHGGFPDWLLAKNLELRSDNPGYLLHVEKLYSEIGKQAKGHLFKDGGCVIGIQVENEYGHCGGFRGEKGERHMRTLKKIAVDCGFDVPYYTATGWGGAVVVEGETLPVQGAYVDAPWDRSTVELLANDNFIFSHIRNDENVGSDFKPENSKADNFTYNSDDYPYATAELGGGLQVTKHRRTIPTALDTQAMVYSKLGSGAKLIGYYMYHGGTNPKGKLTTLQETKAVGNYNDLPILSYDFQAPIGEYGELHQSYRNLKIIHMMINDFGELLADSISYIPPESSQNPEDTESLRFSILQNASMSLLCLNNHQRHRQMAAKKDVQMNINNVAFPSFDLMDGMSIIYPFSWNFYGIHIKYAAAQPLCVISSKESVSMFFWNYCQDMELKLEEQTIYIQQNKSFSITNAEGIVVRFVLISREYAENAWKVNMHGHEALIISKTGVINPDEHIVLYGITQDTEILVHSPTQSDCEHNEIFNKQIVSPAKNLPRKDIVFKAVENPKADSNDLYYRIHLPSGWDSDIEQSDIFLCIDFEGDLANLYHNGELIADWFYTGLSWRVGLKKFAGTLDGELILQIKPLLENADIYLEIKPKYINHAACGLSRITLEYQYDTKKTDMF